MIYHITTRSAWEKSVSEGAYRPPSLTAEGFIHCSFAGQLAHTAQHYFKGQSGLVLLHIDPDLLGAELRLEQGADVSQDFPHLYGALNLEAVHQVTAFDVDHPGAAIDA